MLIHLDHGGIVAATIEEANQVLVEQMGMELDAKRTPMPDGSYFAPERTNNYFFSVGEGETQIEVLIPADTTSGTARYLAKRGAGPAPPRLCRCECWRRSRAARRARARAHRPRTSAGQASSGVLQAAERGRHPHGTRAAA